MILLSGKSQLGSIAEVLAMIIVFALILFVAYYVTRYLGKTMTGARSGGNIRVIETLRIAPDKYLQIIEVAGKYLLLSVSKNGISFLSELDKEEMKFETEEKLPGSSFRDIVQKVIKK